MTADVHDDAEIDNLDAGEAVFCPECGAAMSPSETICPQCGAEFGFYCPVCDEEVPPDATACPHCGAELDVGFEDEGEELIEEADLEIERATFCTNCGEPIGDDDECPSCGADLCPDCGTALGLEDVICPNCGAEFVFSCPNCDQDVPADADLCPHCGFRFEEERDEEEDEADE